MEELSAIIFEKIPLLYTLLAIIGALRVVNKPLFAFLHKLVEVTPTKRDDEVLEVVERSKAYRAFLWVLDFVASVKVPQKIVAVAIEEATAPLPTIQKKSIPGVGTAETQLELTAEKPEAK